MALGRWTAALLGAALGALGCNKSSGAGPSPDRASSKPAAAAELGISLKTMYNKLNQLQEERKTAG